MTVYKTSTCKAGKFSAKINLKGEVTRDNYIYYMAFSMSWQDESNPAVIGYPSGQDGAIQKPFNKSFIDQA